MHPHYTLALMIFLNSVCSLGRAICSGGIRPCEFKTTHSVVAGNELVAMGVALFAFVADRPWHSAFLSLYDGGGLVLSWLKRKYLFESSLTPPQSLSALLTVPKPTYVAVRDVATASPWYVEKFGLRKLSSAEQLQPDGIALQFDASSNPVILLPKDPRFSAVLLYFSLAKSIKLGPD